MNVRIAVAGFGNVGQGLATLLHQHGDEYRRRYGVNLMLVAASDRGGAAVNPTGLDLPALLRAKEGAGTVARSDAGVRDLAGDAFLDHAAADVFVEASSTNFEDGEPGWSWVQGALRRDTDIVLASKGSLALHWVQLMELAKTRGRAVLYSATVGSPLPSLQLADRAFVGCRVLGFEGIVNGTSHQILTAMSRGLSYEDGVRQAQEIGIAETDPTLDVDGWDAAAKAAILANAILGSTLTVHDVPRRGIRAVTAEDLQEAAGSGASIKLIAAARRDGDGVRASVTPQRRPLDDPLGRLSGDAMGIVFDVDPLGRLATTSEGGQSGGITTAMTVLRDILNLARDRGWAERLPA